MSRGEVPKTPKGNEGEPTRWKDLRERVLNISIDLEKEYDHRSRRADVRLEERKARLERLKKMDAPQVIIREEERMIRTNYESLGLFKETLVDLTQFTSGLTVGSLKIVLPPVPVETH